jgi:hypothetical protein
MNTFKGVGIRSIGYIKVGRVEGDNYVPPFSVQRLTILALSVAVRTLQMIEGRDNVDLLATMTFSTEQQDLSQT